MEYNELNSMLEGLEIKETGVETDAGKENKTEVLEEKTRINNILCFRDINHQKNIESNKTNTEEIDINKQINNRMFDINTYKPRPIMDFYPKSSRTVKKKGSSSSIEKATV
tara:strand:- start:1382 stop:1714 length:333 start_codon:yes stop_codon:yes gene_type:complete